jgi:hypothetical protein
VRRFGSFFRAIIGAKSGGLLSNINNLLTYTLRSEEVKKEFMKFNFEGLAKAIGNEVMDFMKVVELVNQLVKHL